MGIRHGWPRSRTGPVCYRPTAHWDTGLGQKGQSRPRRDIYESPTVTILSVTDNLVMPHLGQRLLGTYLWEK